MSKHVAQEITRLLADDEGRPSATRRRAKARLVASIAEGLDRAQIADLRAGLTDGARAAFFDAQLSPAQRQIVITALSHDPRERAEMSSAAALLDWVDAEPIPLPPGLLARAATTFAVANSATRQGVAVGGQRAWRRGALLAAGVGLAAFVLAVAAFGGLLSPGQEMPAPSAEPTRSAQAAAETAMKVSEDGASGQPNGRAIIPLAEPTEKAGSMSARGETRVVSCDHAHEVAGHDHAPSEADKAKDGAPPPSDAALEASCRSQASPADNRSTKLQPRSDGPTPRTASSRQSSAFRGGMFVDGLSVVPDSLFEIARPVVLRIDQTGKDPVDGECVVVHHQTDALRSRGTVNSIWRGQLRESLSRRCAKHSPITTAYEPSELYGPTGPRKPAHAFSYTEELPRRPPLPVPRD